MPITLSDLVVEVSADAAGVKPAMEGVRRSVGDAAADVARTASGMATAFLGIGTALSGVIAYSVKTAGEFAKMEMRLTATLKSADRTRSVLDAIGKLEPMTPFGRGELVAASVNLANFRVSVEDNLLRAANLAARMQISVGDAALVLGKALAGSPEGFESLRNNAGVSSAVLEKFGAALSATGGLAMASKADIEQNAAALKRYLDTDMAGAAEAMKDSMGGAFSTLQSATDRFAESIGKVFLPATIQGIQGLTGMLDKLNAMADSDKRIVAWGTAIAGAVAIVGAAGILAGNQVLQFATQIGGLAGSARVVMGVQWLTSSFAMLNTNVALATAGVSAMPLALVALGAGAIWSAVQIKAMTDENIEAENSMVAGTEAAYQYGKKLGEAHQGMMDAGKSAKEMAQAYQEDGTTTRDLALAQEGLRDAYARAAATGGESAKKHMANLRKLQISLHEVAAALDELERGTKEEKPKWLWELETGADVVKKIEHDLKMGWVDSATAASQYQRAINTIKNELSALTQGTDVYRKKLDELYKAEERAKDLGWDPGTMKEHSGAPPLPGAGYPTGAAGGAGAKGEAGAAAGEEGPAALELRGAADAAGKAKDALEAVKPPADAAADALGRTAKAADDAASSFSLWSKYGQGEGGAEGFDMVTGFFGQAALADEKKRFESFFGQASAVPAAATAAAAAIPSAPPGTTASSPGLPGMAEMRTLMKELLSATGPKGGTTIDLRINGQPGSSWMGSGLVVEAVTSDYEASPR